jgi:hypothetical protein
MLQTRKAEEPKKEPALGQIRKITLKMISVDFDDVFQDGRAILSQQNFRSRRRHHLMNDIEHTWRDTLNCALRCDDARLQKAQPPGVLFLLFLHSSSTLRFVAPFGIVNRLACVTPAACLGLSFRHLMSPLCGSVH